MKQLLSLTTFGSEKPICIIWRETCVHFPKDYLQWNLHSKSKFNADKKSKKKIADNCC